MISDRQRRVLVVAPTGRDSQFLCELLRKNGLVCESCAGLYRLCEELRAGAGAILLTEEALGSGAPVSLSNALGEQPKWPDVPVILLADFEADCLLARPDGTIRHIPSFARPVFNERGDLTEYVGTVIDNTERIPAQERLRNSERRFRELAEAIPHHVWSSSIGGTVSYWNQRLVDYTGLTAEEIRQGGWAALHPDDVERVRAAWREAWSRGTLYEQEQRIRGRDGRYRRFLRRGVPVPGGRGENLEWFGTDTDIEEQRRAEEGLQKAQADLAHMARVTLMGELAASIAHEVSQPLGAIVANAGACVGWLGGSEPNVAEARAAAAQIADQAMRASEVIARIRSLMKKSPPQMSAVDINEVIQEVLTLTHHEIIRFDVSLRTELAPGLPAVRGDPVQLKQVLANLIMNAIEAVSAREAGPRELVVTSQILGSDQILVAVRDSGAGFDPETVEELFKPFVSHKREGIGMGLAISRSIVEAHGGRLWAARNENAGATFQFCLPAGAQSDTAGQDAIVEGPARLP
jgi:PAS domain S-box-containing protein